MSYTSINDTIPELLTSDPPSQSDIPADTYEFPQLVAPDPALDLGCNSSDCDEYEVLDRNDSTIAMRGSNQSIGDDICRICHLDEATLPTLGALASPCLCRGSMALVHLSCLERWLTECGSDCCELCGFRYCTERIPRHGLFHSITLWISSGIDAKLLLFDLIWFSMSSPIAMFATYLMMLSISVIQQHGTGLQQSGLALFLLATSSLLLAAYFLWVVNCFRHHMREWYRWWRRNFIVHILDVGGLPMDQNHRYDITEPDIIG